MRIRLRGIFAGLLAGGVGCLVTVVPLAAQEPVRSLPAAVAGADAGQDEEPGREGGKSARAEGAQAVEEFQHFLRIRRDGKGRAKAMETSVTRYIGKNAAGETVTVDLIGVVHIGEKSYYEQLDELFKGYDGLLYELVAPEGTRIPEGGREASDGMNPVAALQLGMKSVLGLEFQLEHINYMAENFIHADMTPEEFAESMKNNDESLMKFMLKAIGTSMAMQSSGGTTDAELMMALFSSNRELALRRVMAEQMQNMEASMSVFKGREGSTIIDHRNAKALSVLKQVIGQGKTNLAVFYGAGHLPDMQRRLLSEFGMQRAGQFWLKAWELGD